MRLPSHPGDNWSSPCACPQMLNKEDWRELREYFAVLSSLTKNVDNNICSIVFLSFGNNLYFICLQLLNGLSYVFLPNWRASVRLEWKVALRSTMCICWQAWLRLVAVHHLLLLLVRLPARPHHHGNAHHSQNQRPEQGGTVGALQLPVGHLQRGGAPRGHECMVCAILQSQSTW